MDYFINEESDFSVLMDCIAKNDLNRILENKLTLLSNFIEIGKTHLVKIALEYGADPNYDPFNIMPPIVLAIYRKNPEALFYLIKYGANLSVKNEKGLSLLIFSIKYAPICSFIILNSNVDIHTICSEGNNAIIMAVKMNEIKIVIELIRRGININHKNKNGLSPFWIASYDKNIKMMKLLADCGANVNTANNEGITPLINAIKQQDLAIIEFLLDKNAEVYNLVNKSFKTLDFVIMTGNIRIMHFFSKYYSKKDYLFIGKYPSIIYTIFTDKASPESISYLIQMGADINQTYIQDGLLVTPLMISIIKNNFLITMKLLELGANPHFGENNKPLNYAIEKANENDFRYVDILRNYGVVYNHFNDNKYFN